MAEGNREAGGRASANASVFERSVTFQHLDGTSSTGRIELYQRGCFILEARQGVEKREKAEALAAVTQAKARATKKGIAIRDSSAWDEAMLKVECEAEHHIGKTFAPSSSP